MMRQPSLRLRRTWAAALLAAMALSAAAALAQDLRGAGGVKGGPAAKAAARAPEGQGRTSLFDLLYKGGPVMIPIGLCSVLALAVAVERFISLRREKVIPRAFMAGLKAAFAGPEDVERGVAHCEGHPSPLSRIFKAGLRRLPQGGEAMEKAIEDAGGREAYKLQRSLRPLSVIATVSPLLGLLGTVYGMISAFQSASAQGVGKADTLAIGIYEALVTTAAGLTIAIPILVVHQVLSSRVDMLVDLMDEEAIEFLEYAAYGKAAGNGPAAADVAEPPAEPAGAVAGAAAS